MSSGLKCFEPSLYSSIEACDKIPNRCIAPTARRARCQWTVDNSDVVEASMSRKQAMLLPDSQDRDDKIGEFLLLHCCSKRHRHKLLKDETGCLEELVRIYGVKIDMIELIPTISSPSRSRSRGEQDLDRQQVHPTRHAINTRLGLVMTTESPDLKTEKEYPHKQKSASKSQLSDKVDNQGLATPEKVTEMNLRSGTTLPGFDFRRNLEFFTPYKTGPRQSVRDNLEQGVPRNCTMVGNVYSFTWPSHPGFVKIGYTGNTAQERVKEWQTCNPEATLSHFAHVDYPERIERLIHLEMAQFRHRISICKVCGKSHEEWFKSPLDEVNRVISDWAKLTIREPLYDSGRKLTTSWHKRLVSFEAEITASSLLALLDTEAEMKAEAERNLVEPAPQQSVRSELTESTLNLLDSINSAIDLMQPRDQMLTFFKDFMLYLAQEESLRMTNLQPISAKLPHLEVSRTSILSAR